MVQRHRLIGIVLARSSIHYRCGQRGAVQMTMSIRRISAGLAALAMGCGLQSPAAADTIAVIGTGNVAGALGTEFAAQGHDIVYGSRSPDREEVASLVEQTGGNASATTQMEAVVDADMVVLAVPGEVAEEVAASLGDLSGKIIIDPTNRIERGDDGVFRYTMETSNAELIQAAAPGATVVKAFNALSFRTMIEPGGPVSIPLVGDDADAKARVAELVSGMGLEPLDVGPLSEASVVEGMLAIWMNARMAGTPFDYHLRRTGD